MRGAIVAVLWLAGFTRGLNGQGLVFRAVPTEPPDVAAAVVEAPVLLNPVEVEETMRMLYPPALSRHPVPVELVLLLVVDAKGTVDLDRVKVVSASHPWVAAAAKKLARVLRVAPAMANQFGSRDPTATRAILPLTWTPDTTSGS
jgi:hypothetical protein